MSRRRLIGGALGVLCALAWARGRAAASRPEEAAQTSALLWLALVDEGKYDESWDEAAPFFRNALPKEKWREALGAVRRPLGKVLSRKLKSANPTEHLPGAPAGRYVVIQYDTDFESKAKAVETITPMADPEGAWRVSGYFIQ